MKSIDLIRDSKRRYVNCKTLVFYIKYYCYKLLLSNQLYLRGDKNGVGNAIQSLSKFLLVEVDLDIIQDEE